MKEIRLRDGVVDFLVDLFSGFVVWLIVHIVVFVWMMFWGWLAYGATIQVFWIALYTSLWSFAVSFPVVTFEFFIDVRIKWRDVGVTYLLGGLLAGIIVTVIGGIVCLILRLSGVEIPDALPLSLGIAGLSVGSAIIIVIWNGVTEILRKSQYA